jgi:hypothetical protein
MAGDLVFGVPDCEAFEEGGRYDTGRKDDLMGLRRIGGWWNFPSLSGGSLNTK